MEIIQNCDSRTSDLMEAVTQGDCKKVIELLKSADSFPHTGSSALCLATQNKHYAIAQLLLDHGCDVNVVDYRGNSPLHYSVESNDLATATLLLHRGADINNQKNLLLTAARRALAEMVKILVAYGANVNVSDQYGWTALHYAVLQYGATLLKKSQSRRFSMVEDVVRALLTAGANVNRGNHRAVETLLKFGGDTELSTKNGFTPLHLACLHGSATIVDLLLTYGADINATCNSNKVPYQYLANSELDLSPSLRKDSFRRKHESTKIKNMLQDQILMMHSNRVELLGYNKIQASKIRLVRLNGGPIVEEVRVFSKSFRVVDCTTLHTIFSSTHNPTYARNPKFEQQLDMVVGDLNKMFPSLGSVSKYLVRKARKRNDLLDKASRKFMTFVKEICSRVPALPAEVAVEVLKFFTAIQPN